jgi:diguanylate cyclase (GGDEF)-like protein
MRLRGYRGSVIGRLGLTRQVALLSLLPIVALGYILAHVLQTQITDRALADASQSARLITRVGIQPRLTPATLRNGLAPATVRALDAQLSARGVAGELARIKIWNAADTVVYSGDHSLIGHALKPSDDLEHALAGTPGAATLVTPSKSNETASEVGLGKLVEVYVPLRFSAAARPAGAFEIYLSYQPIAAAVAREKRTIVLLVGIGLALLWAILYRIVARASRRLRRQARENDRLARYDQLTGLPNRTLFIERVSAAVAGGVRRGTAAVLLIDLDRFTEINNTLGAANGDRVLCEVARRLSRELGEETLLARLGADEYAVLCPRADGIAGAQATAAAVEGCLDATIMLDGVALNIEASIGIGAIGEHARDADALLRCADRALAHARSRGTRVEVYSPACDRFDAASLRLLGEVRGALERGELILHYQPRADLRSGQITGVEALVRWHHPEFGLLAPARFIPLVEQTALIGPLTVHVINAALAQLRAWREQGIELEMSVNLSARNLLDPGLAVNVAVLLERHGLPAEALTVEVTESAAMTEPGRAVAVLEALRAAGVGVAVDDFGTGNASIEYLTKLPVSELKIDRSFITDILADTRAQAIVRSMIDLARNLGLTVVAEGIETKAVMEYLARLGCDTGQGYFISPPAPPAELTPRLPRAPARADSATARPGARRRLASTRA